MNFMHPWYLTIKTYLFICCFTFGKNLLCLLSYLRTYEVKGPIISPTKELCVYSLSKLQYCLKKITNGLLLQYHDNCFAQVCFTYLIGCIKFQIKVFLSCYEYIYFSDHRVSFHQCTRAWEGGLCILYPSGNLSILLSTSCNPSCSVIVRTSRINNLVYNCFRIRP